MNSEEEEVVETRKEVIGVKVKRREIKERLPPDLDERYVILGEYREGDGKRAVVPLILEVERKRSLSLLLVVFVLNLVLLFLFSINVLAAFQLASAHAEVQNLMTNRTRLPWIEIREVINVGNQKLVELRFSFGIEILDNLLWIRRSYAVVGGSGA
ncbi:MAG: hypothetical protein QXM43_00225 [Desulfurococcaceae archaeon]